MRMVKTINSVTRHYLAPSMASPESPKYFNSRYHFNGPVSYWIAMAATWPAVNFSPCECHPQQRETVCNAHSGEMKVKSLLMPAGGYRLISETVDKNQARAKRFSCSYVEEMIRGPKRCQRAPLLESALCCKCKETRRCFE
ncbi:hypothetical protein GBF38_003291 [Nibea albiflora]|uniref:Uncharacterized protein n=1 Tax=Nibea albiflora TaxID=240163 RepID=A0ACB7FJQ9_NIBAL|nr:hypothetical protein GBF38_003291 [Nibea albiflora]